jgi:hypothetical protein
MTSLETLKTEFINALDWNEEEGLICNNDGQDIRDYLETYANKIADEKGLEIEITEHEYPLEFQPEKKGWVDFQIQIAILNCDDESTHESFYSKNSEGFEIFADRESLDDENNIFYFTLYTSVNYSEKLEKLKNRIEA